MALYRQISVEIAGGVGYDSIKLVQLGQKYRPVSDFLPAMCGPNQALLLTFLFGVDYCGRFADDAVIGFLPLVEAVTHRSGLFIHRLQAFQL